MRLIDRIRKILKIFDLFPTSQFIRYQQEGDFKTATGGFISLVIIIIFIILFYSLGIQTIKQSIIYGSVTYQIDSQPEPLTFSFKPSGSFMFAIGIQYLNLNDPNISYFDISMRQNYFEPFYQTINSTVIPLIQCTPDHFSYNQEILNAYTKFNFSNYLCPPLNYQFHLQGRIISDIFAGFSIYIEYCNKTINSKCVSNSDMLILQSIIGGNFNLIVPVLSTIINPGNSDYKQVYLQDHNYFFFTLNNGVEINAQIQQYQIDTDISLMPYQDIQTQLITTIPQLFLSKSKIINNHQYIKLQFTKSSISTTFTRSFNKIDSYLSFVGGLVGTVLLLFFILGAYSQKTFLINIAQDLFKITSNQNPPQFNIFYFLTTYIKKLLDIINIKLKWQKTDIFLQSLQEIQKQLSIEFILNRINYIQYAITSILNDHQLQTLFLNNKKTLSQGQAERKKFNISKYIHQIQKYSIQNKSNQSSLSVINSNIQENTCKATFVVEEAPKISRIQLMNQDHSASENQDQVSNNLKVNLRQVIEQSNQGNIISHRILRRINKKVFPQLGITIHELKNEQGQVKQIQKYEIHNTYIDEQKKDENLQFQFVT